MWRPERRLRLIREVRFRSRLDRSDELVVCGGLFGNREELVSVAEVSEIVPRQERVFLRSVPQPVPHQSLRLRLHGA